MIKKEDMKWQIGPMAAEDHATFLDDAVRGRYLRTWCIYCDDFETCDKTADKLDDCRMETEAGFKNQEHERWASEKDTDETEAESSVEKQNKKR